jgi:O-antigen ligase
MQYSVPPEYEPVTPLPRHLPAGMREPADGGEAGYAARPEARAGASAASGAAEAELPPFKRRGHALSYAGLFLFTTLAYVRPYELHPAFAFLSSAAFYVALATLACYIPSQLASENSLTVWAREVKLVLLLALLCLLSVFQAHDPGQSWDSFWTYFKVVVMFIVMVNVVRTELRLRGMIWLALGISFVVSAYALNDYRGGQFRVSGVRIGGVLGGLFENPNDLALQLVIMIPLAWGLLLAARGFVKKLLYAACALVMVGGVVVTFSRGGFLGLLCAAFVMLWKTVGRRNRLALVVVTVVLAAAFAAAAPSGYRSRLFSAVDTDRDTGSVSARYGLLQRSIYVTLHHPLMGVGIGNFPLVSVRDQVSHNAYTQVSAEVGIPAMLVYVLFLFAPLKRLRRVERETERPAGGGRRRSRHYYLAVGLQASLVGYMVSSLFASVAFHWYGYYLIGYALCLARLYQSAAPQQENSGVETEWSRS